MQTPLPLIAVKYSSTLVEAIFIILVIVLTLKVNVRLIQAVLFCIAETAIIGTVITILAHNKFQYMFILVYIIDVLLVVSILRLSWAKSIASIAISAIILMIGNLFAAMCFALYGIPLNTTLEDVRSYIIGSAIMFTVSFITIIVIHFMRLTAIMPEEIKRKRNMFSAMYIIITFFMIAINMSFVFYSPIGSANAWYSLFNFIIILVYFALGLYNTYRNNELEIKKQELEYQKLYSSTLNEILEGHRRIKHNFNNILHTINGYVISGKYEELKEYFDEVLKKDAENSKVSCISLSKIKNPALYGLLNAKVSTAIGKSLNFRIDISGEIGHIHAKVYELCEILGILLDNAIEAAEKSLPRKVNVRIYRDDEDMLSIVIENTFEGQVDVEKIFEKGYTTSGDSSRGLGLWMVRNSVNKSKNMLLNTSIDGESLRHHLVIRPEARTSRQVHNYLPAGNALEKDA